MRIVRQDNQRRTIQTYQGRPGTLRGSQGPRQRTTAQAMIAFDGARDHEPLGDALAIGATEYVAGNSVLAMARRIGRRTVGQACSTCKRCAWLLVRRESRQVGQLGDSPKVRGGESRRPIHSLSQARCFAEAALEFCAGLALAGLLIALWIQV